MPECLHICNFCSIFAPNFELVNQFIALMKHILYSISLCLVVSLTACHNSAYDSSYDYAKSVAEEALSKPIDVPVPHDAAGGYTHEQHKNNYYAMYYAGFLYDDTGDERYAAYVREMMLRYAAMYPSLGEHPYKGSPVPGRLFWQTLNESVWLVHTSQAYAYIYPYLSASDRDSIEQNLLFPICEFIERGTDANYATFNRMHNHATWACAAVGMTGYATGNRELVDKALYGSDKDGKAGFLLQMEQLFSPDGYFTEGAYYLRYAIWPFMLFAQVIEKNEPELHIFERRDGILLKAVHALIQQAYDGIIIRMNDALKKTYCTQEIVAAVDIAYWASRDPQLLSIAAEQGSFVLSEAGRVTAEAIAAGKAVPFRYQSVVYRDGADGSKGGVAIIRGSEARDGFMFTMKATSHGLSHGHYDKMTIALYDDGHEILTDYGAARFLNIESKSGGRYTHENDTYAQQTVAHNTAVVDCKSHFHADYKTSMQYSSVITYASITDSIAEVSALDTAAYKEERVRMRRTIVVMQPLMAGTEYPIAIDILRLTSPEKHIYDLPFHFSGHMINTSFPARKETNHLTAMGSAYGYEHLWKECESAITADNAWFTILQGERFYSVTTTLDEKVGAKAYLVRSGANDPDNNLRSEPAVLFRQQGKSEHVFVSVIEPHGLFDPNLELTKGYLPQTEHVRVVEDDERHTTVEVVLRGKENPIIYTINY